MIDRFFKLGKDSIIYTAGSVVSKLINFLLIPIFTRVFATQAYGVFDILILVTSIIMTLGNMGLSSSLTLLYFEAKDEEEKRTVVTSNFLFSFVIILVIALVVILFADQVSFLLLKDSSYNNYLIVAVLTIPFVTMLNFAATLYRLSFKPLKFFYITLGHAALSAVLSIYFVVIRGMDIMGALLGILISAMIFTFISFYLVRDKFNWRFSANKLKEMMKISLPLAPVGIGIWIMDFSPRYFLVQTQTLSQVGLYAVGFKLAGALGVLISAFRLANVPHQFEIAKDSEAKRFYSKTLLYYFLITLFIALGLSIFSREITNVFLGMDYFNSYKVMFPLAFSFIFVGLYHIVGLGLMLVKKTYLITAGTFAGVISAIMLNMILAPSFGFLGAAIANVISYFIGFVAILSLAQRYYYIKFEFRKIFIISIISIILIFIGLALNFDPVFLRIIAKIGLIVLFSVFSYFVLGSEYVKEIKDILLFLKSCLRLPFKNS